MEIRPGKDIEAERDEKVLKMLVEAVRLMGGPKKLIEMRNLTWLPSLLRAFYAVLLRDAGYTYERIAETLGITRATVERMLTADPEVVKRKIEGLSEEDIDDHIAGGIARLAYIEMKNRAVEEEIDSVTMTSKALGIDWPIRVASMLRGLDFPVEMDVLKERLKNVSIMGIDIDDILGNIEYPISSPVDLIKKISTYLRKIGKIK